MRLFEKFIKINPRYTDKVKDFIKDNCPQAKTIEELKDMGLGSTVNDLEIKNGCETCNLCKNNVFKKSRDNLKKLVKELENTDRALVPEKFSEISDKFLNIRFRVGDKPGENYKIDLKYDNLHQIIISDALKYYSRRLNKINLDEIYFSQIAEILISTNTFIDDIKNIKKMNYEYMKAMSDAQTDNEYFRNPLTSRVPINEEIIRVMKKYLISERWSAWIKNILSFDFEKNKKVIFRFLPNGTVLLKREFKIINGTPKLTKEPIVAGDESPKEIQDFQNKYHINIQMNQTSRKKRPILEFKKYLGWYKLHEEGKSYLNIFDIELEENFDNWREFSEYKSVMDNDDITTLSNGMTKIQVERMAINRIKYGIYKLRRRIFKEIK